MHIPYWLFAYFPVLVVPETNTDELMSTKPRLMFYSSQIIWLVLLSFVCCNIFLYLVVVFQDPAVFTNLHSYCKCPGVHMSYIFCINLMFIFRSMILVNLYYIFSLALLIWKLNLWQHIEIGFLQVQRDSKVKMRSSFM